MGIKGSVGGKKNKKNADNNHSDVVFVQGLLNYHIMFNPKMRALATFPLTGGDMPQTIAAIVFFQRDVLGHSPATGRIEPGDKTINALMGKVDGMPEVVAPAGDRLHKKLLEARNDDFLGLYLGDEIEVKTCMIDLLLLPDVDDAYLAEAVVYDYLNKNQPGIKLGGQPKESYLKKALIKEMDKKYSTEAFVGLINRLYSNEILGGLQEYNKAANVETAAIRFKEDGTRSELSIAIENVQEWLLQHNKNPKSIYHCLNLNVLGEADWLMRLIFG